jgi:hypothetical protein
LKKNLLQKEKKLQQLENEISCLLLTTESQSNENKELKKEIKK